MAASAIPARGASAPTGRHAAPPTYRRRTRRLTARQADALESLWPRYGVDLGGGRRDPAELFGCEGNVVVEIGFGAGETTLAMALAFPNTNVLAVEVHTPGAGTLLHELRALELDNVRVALGDARELLAEQLHPGTLAGIGVFFPDPWPKTRHHKRRLLTPWFLRLAAERLRPGGWLHVATDWTPYAEQILDSIAAEPLLDNPFDGAAPRPAWRPVTRFERRGLKCGRLVHDIVALRLATA